MDNTIEKIMELNKDISVLIDEWKPNITEQKLFSRLVEFFQLYSIGVNTNMKNMENWSQELAYIVNLGDDFLEEKGLKEEFLEYLEDHQKVNN